MLSNEEIHAMEILKSCGIKCNGMDIYKILLNLIHRNSKEIEELKEDNKHQWEERCKLTFELENSTSKDKIKAKIEVLDKEEKEALKGTKGQDRYAIKQEYMHKRSGLKSLLEKE